MLEKIAQPMSPRTQAMGAAPSGDEETRLFEDGFTQMAYNVLVNKFPDLMAKVITFKLLDSDVESGSGVGAFVVQHDNEIIYVPVVMADNQIKPLDLFYNKGLNVFLPLNNDWLNEISQLALDEMGEPVQTPKSLRRDVDTRNIMIPPTTGRYAYAAAKSNLEPLDIHGDMFQMLKKLQNKTASEKPQLMSFLAKAPDTVKEAFVRVLKNNPKLAAQVTQLYGLDALTSAVTKTASATSPIGGGLFVADKDTPATKFKDVFGDRAPEAFQGMLSRGYVAKDDRGKYNIPVKLQTLHKLTQPTTSGFYTVYTPKGEKKNAFILVEPRTFWGHDTPEVKTHRTYTMGKRHAGRRPDEHSVRYIIVTDDGWYQTNAVVAEQLDGRELPKNCPAFSTLMNDKDVDKPTVGSRGIFVKKLGNNFVGTIPFRIDSVSTDSKDVRRITTDMGIQLITDKNAAKMGLHTPKGGQVMYIPPDARFIKLKDDQEDMPLLRNAQDLQKWIYDEFDAMGAQSVTAKNAGANEISIDGETPVNKIAAIKRAALKHDIHFDDAASLVEEAAAGLAGSRVSAYVLSPRMYEKIAQMPMMGGAPPQGGMPPGGAPPGAPPMDPNMAGGMPPQGPPPPPSPLDIAMGEAHTQIQQQMADMQQQQMALQDKVQTLMMVQQRAQEIAGGGGPTVGQGAPPMPPPGAAPQGPPQGGMPPGAPQGGMPPGPPQEGMPQPAPQGAMGGMAAAAGAPVDPSTMGGGASMKTEAPSAMEIQQQVNPQFLEQAGQLADTNAFDAAAIASMAQAPSFRTMVVEYVPTLERALDNLGRVLLTVWMQESELKEQLGDEEFSDLEDNIRAVFEGLGSLILQINRNAIVMESGQ